MAEAIGALEAISLASSLVQFIELGVKICVSAYKSADGLATDVQDTNQWTEQLQSLDGSISKCGEYEVTAETRKEDREIIRIGIECHGIARDLLKSLDRYRAGGTGAAKLLASVKGTFLYMMGGKDKVEGMRQRLERHHQLLRDHVLFSLQYEPPCPSGGGGPPRADIGYPMQTPI